MARSTSPVAALVSRLIPGIRFPWLFAILAGLLAIDLVIPDPVPFIDEAILTMLTVLAASWRTGRTDERPPPKDVTPVDETEGLLSEGDAAPTDDDDACHSQ
jgi:hypothetical protein